MMAIAETSQFMRIEASIRGIETKVAGRQ